MTPMQPKLKLNLGCGQRKMDGYVNVDASPVCAPDQVVDLEKTPWPWPDDAVDTVKLIHVLEHLGQQPATFLAILRELWRVCCAGDDRCSFDMQTGGILLLPLQEPRRWFSSLQGRRTLVRGVRAL